MNIRQVCKDFVRMYCKGQEVEAIQASMKMDNVWGMRVDWHEMGDALEALEAAFEAERTGATGEGFALYLIK